MEGEKEEEEKQLHHHITATSSEDCQDLPIMHWEELSQRIVELEKQEEERRKRKVSCHQQVEIKFLTEHRCPAANQVSSDIWIKSSLYQDLLAESVSLTLACIKVLR